MLGFKDKEHNKYNIRLFKNINERFITQGYITIDLKVSGKRFYRKHNVKVLQKLVAKLMDSDELESIDIIAYDYLCQTVIDTMLLKTRYPKSFYNKIIFISPFVSSRFNFTSIKGHYKELFNFYSYSDKDALLNCDGQAGYLGFTKRVRNVKNILTNYKHYDYFDSKYSTMLEYLTKIIGGK